MSSSLPVDAQQTPNSDSSSPLPTQGIASIDAPQVTDGGSELKLEAKSVKTVAQALNICKAVEQNNQARSLRTADIQALHDGAPPRSGVSNAEKGKSWQSNASTGWLSGIVGRVSQRYVNAIISQIYVTSSALPTSVNDSKTKTDLLRMKTTQIVRSWDGYTGLVNSLAVETTLQGYCYAVFLDPYTYKPTFFKQDRAFVAEMAGQHARDQQFMVAKMDYRLDEFISLFTDEKSAEDVGYNLQNCVEAANTATIADPREDAMTTQYRKFVEMQNEGVLGLSYTSAGARIVQTWLLFNREYDGQVSFWLIDRKAGKLLRFSFKLFKSMEDALAMFSFEPGNGCIHSSKGLGRKLAALAIMKELFRNGVIDNSRMAGLMVLRCDAKDKSKFAPAVMSPFLMIDKSVEIPEQQFTANADAYKVTDQQIDTWAEQTVGAYLTQQIADEDKTEKTATEAQIDAKRENEAADIQIRRCLDQMANLTQIQQLRIWSDENIKLAKNLREKFEATPEKISDPAAYKDQGEADPLVLRHIVEALQAGVEEDEIRLFREDPASIFAHVSDRAVQQGLSAAKATFAGSTNIDWSKLDYRVLEGMVGAEAAKEVYIPTADQTLLAEAGRLQLMESIAMSESGLPIPVSIRDAHIIHGKVLQGLLTKIAPVLSSTAVQDKQMKAAELTVNHLGEHLQKLTELGQNKGADFDELDKFYQGFKKQLAEVVQIHEQAAAAEQAVTQQIRSEGAPQAAPGASADMQPAQPFETAQGVPGVAAESSVI